MTSVARFLEQGTGCVADPPRAFALYRDAAALDPRHAAYKVARCYERGVGVAASAEDAARWFRLGADAGDPRAQVSLGHAYRRGEGVAIDGAEALRWYQRAADAGDPRAQVSLGDAYRQGEGVAIDGAEALRWYQRAADADHAAAYVFVGRCHALGLGVPVDLVLAVEWYRRGAVRDDAYARYLLGMAYEGGRGVAIDLDEAVRWYALAAPTIEAARVRLRIVRWRRHPVLRRRTQLTKAIGATLLAYHAATAPFSFHWRAFLLFFAILFAVPLLGFAVAWLFRGRRPAAEWKANDAASSRVATSPWRLLRMCFGIATEDGCFLVPLLYLGISIPSALVAGTLFGFAHYPVYGPKTCALIAVAYTAVALFVLPYGIWTVIAAHVTWDLLLDRLDAPPGP